MIKNSTMFKPIFYLSLLLLFLSCNRTTDKGFYNPVFPAQDSVGPDSSDTITVEEKITGTFKKRGCSISRFSYHTTKTGYIATFDVDSAWTDSASLAYLQVGAVYEMNMYFTKQIETDNDANIKKEKCTDTSFRYFKTYCNGTPENKKKEPGEFHDDYTYNQGPIYLLDSPRGKTIDSICKNGTKLKAFVSCNFGNDYEAREEYVKILYKKKTYWVQTIFNWAQHEDFWIDSIPPHTIMHYQTFLQETNENGKELIP